MTVVLVALVLIHHCDRQINFFYLVTSIAPFRMLFFGPRGLGCCPLTLPGALEGRDAVPWPCRGPWGQDMLSVDLARGPQGQGCCPLTLPGDLEDKDAVPWPCQGLRWPPVPPAPFLYFQFSSYLDPVFWRVLDIYMWWHLMVTGKKGMIFYYDDRDHYLFWKLVLACNQDPENIAFHKCKLLSI